MKVSIQVLGSLGDVMPYVSVATALQSRGVSVSILAPRDYGPLIEAVGINVDSPAEFTLSGWMDEAAGRGTLSGPLSLFRDWGDMIVPHVDDVMERCIEAGRGADIVVANLICAPARIAAEAHGAAFMLSAQQPVLSPTRHHPCAMVWRPWMGEALNRSGYGVVRLSQRLVGVSLTRHRKRLGLAGQPALSDMRTHLGQALTKVTSVSPALIGKPPPEWKKQDRLTAYPSLASRGDQQISSVLEHFLGSGPPPVYVGLGSLGPLHGEALAHVALAALKQLGLRAIFPEDFPDGRIGARGHFISGYVPHDRLFPRCAAVVHHGGAGTSDTALRAGVAQVVQPHMLDQFWHAARLQGLGVAGPALPAKRLGLEAMVRALEMAVSVPAGEAAQVAMRTARNGDGASELATLIIQEAERFSTARN